MEYIDNYITVEATKRIIEIITTFDFNKVVDVMEHLNWEYKDKNMQSCYPDVDVLKDIATKDLIFVYQMYHTSDHADNNEPYYVSGGGFEASYWYNNADNISDMERDNFSLKFIVEEAYN